MERGDDEGRIDREIRFCLVYEENHSCMGAGGQKLRSVCLWCPNFMRQAKETEGDQNGNDGHRGGTGTAGGAD